MANSLGGFDITQFALEAISTLHDKLGIAARVYRGYSQEPGQKGNTITIGTPSKGTVQNFGSGAVDVNDGTTNITLDHHREIHFALTEKQMHGTMEDIVRIHAAPQLKELAGDVDAKLAALYKDVPWSFDVDTTAGDEKRNIIQPRKILAQNGVDVDSEGMMFLAVNAEEEARFLESSIVDATVVGDEAGRMMNLAGSIAMFGGTNIFRSGKIQQHTSGTVVSAGNDNAGAANGAAAVGATSFAVDGLNASETIVAGDSFVFAGHTQRYVATSTTTLSTGAGTVSFSPALQTTVADNEVVTFEAGASSNADAYYGNIMFHRDAFALATAPLSSERGSAQARAQGYQVQDVIDDETGIALRAMVWYERASGLNVAADILYGVETLDGNKACLLRGDV